MFPDHFIRDHVVPDEQHVPGCDQRSSSLRLPWWYRISALLVLTPFGLHLLAAGRRSRRVLRELARAQGWRNLRSLSQATDESIPSVYRLLLLLHARGRVLRNERRRRFFALDPVQP